jgi:hypothetical protein
MEEDMDSTGELVFAAGTQINDGTVDPTFRDSEDRIVYDKMINEGNYILLSIRTVFLQEYRVQDLEEECTISLRYHGQHCAGMAHPHHPVVSRQDCVRGPLPL